jgi:tetrapyrrole methylase family protein / MazG family protein
MPDRFHSALPPDAPKDPFQQLCWIMDRLLAPGGCPWDREQTHESLKQYLIEEAYEVYDAIEEGDFEHLKEELGDVALQVVFHADLARKAGKFEIKDVLQGICDKLIRRHPHVFGDTSAENAGQVLANWEQIKKNEKEGKVEAPSLVGGIPGHLPALQKAHRLQEKTGRVGFDWPDIEGALTKVREEFEELAGARDEKSKERIFEEMGDVLFSLVNACRFMGIQPEEALQSACAKFTRRFQHIERVAAGLGRSLKDMTLEEMDAIWDEAKKKKES